MIRLGVCTGWFMLKIDQMLYALPGFDFQPGSMLSLTQFLSKIDCVRSREERSFWNPLQLIWWNQKHCLECLSIALLLYIISSSCLTSLLFTFFFGLLPLYHCFRLLACNTQRSVDGGCWIFSDAFVVVTLSLVLFTFYDGWQTMKWRTAVTHCYMIKTVTSKQVIPTTLEK